MTIDEMITVIEKTGDSETLEDLRSKVADLRDGLFEVRDDLFGFQATINDLQTEKDDLSAEILLLKEENGRLYRERINNRIDETVEKVNEVLSDEDEIKNLKANIKL